MKSIWLIVASVLSTSLSAGANWPEFRGPLSNGHAESSALPLKWSETENVAWKVPIRGRAWSSPVVWDGLVWMTSASDDGRELYAVCVELDTGKVRHDVKLFDVAHPWEIHKFNSHASPTPVIEEGRVYLSWGSLGLACLDSSTAEVLWTRRDLPQRPDRRESVAGPRGRELLRLANLCRGTDLLPE